MSLISTSYRAFIVTQLTTTEEIRKARSIIRLCGRHFKTQTTLQYCGAYYTE